jgi:nucleotide-binding universal stress UspA family protein
MSYKTVLVYFSGDDRADTLMDVATMVAAQNEAHVIGLYVVPAPRVMPAVGIHIPAELIENQRDWYREEAAKIKTRFERKVSGDSVTCEWRTIDAHDPITSRVVADHARMCDLVIIGQPDFDEDSADVQNLPADILMESGRPLLLVPAVGPVDRLGSSVFVAWNGEREAARAAFDALPLLVNAKTVRLHWVNPEGANSGIDAVPGAELAAAMARHGVKVEAGHSICDDISVGDEVLSRLADHGCDLLVMGGYGHSRFSEMVFGGATRHILRHMTVPVLMSH